MSNLLRQLDVDVAERVLGYKVQELVNDDFPDYICYTDNDNEPAFILPQYSSFIELAWPLIEKLQKEGWYCNINCLPNGVNDVTLQRYKSNDSIDIVEAGGGKKSLSTAICLAVLKTVGGVNILKYKELL